MGQGVSYFSAEKTGAIHRAAELKNSTCSTCYGLPVDSIIRLFPLVDIGGQAIAAGGRRAVERGRTSGRIYQLLGGCRGNDSALQEGGSGALE